MNRNLTSGGGGTLPDNNSMVWTIFFVALIQTIVGICRTRAAIQRKIT